VVAGLNFVGSIGGTAGRFWFAPEAATGDGIRLDFEDFGVAGVFTLTLILETVDAVDVLRDRVVERTSESAVLKVEELVVVDNVDGGRAVIDVDRKPAEEFAFFNVGV